MELDVGGRSALTSIRLVPAASASGSSSSEPMRWWGSSKREAARAAQTPRGVPSRASNSPASRAVSWGRKWKIPPPSLSMTTIRTGVVDLAQGGEASEVVEEAEVAGDDRRRPPGRRRGPDPGGDKAVEPVGAAVAEEQGVGVDRPQERLLVADRHARRRVDEVAVGVGAAEGECRPGSVSVSRPSSSASIASRAAASAAIQASGGSRSSPRRAAHPAARSVGSARRIAAARRVGSFQSPLGSTTIWSAPGGGEPGPQRLAGRHLPEPEDEVGHDPGANLSSRSRGRRR